MKIAVVTDSSCGLDMHKKYKDLKVVPLMITKENGEQVYDDLDLSQDEFYRMLDAEALKTSQSVPKDMLSMWDETLKEYDQIIVLLLSKGLSGQYNTFRMFSEEEEYKGKVFVADTNGVSIILEHLVEKAFEKIEEGKDAEVIRNEIDALNSSYICFIIPKSLTTLVRGGRISKAAAAMAKLLKITPILRYNGQIDKETKERTFKKAVNEALTLIKSRTDDVKYIDISYSRTEEDVVDLVKELVELNGFIVNKLEAMPNVITCHTGRETFAFVAWMK